jgi:predicted nucleic acid-binding protein
LTLVTSNFQQLITSDLCIKELTRPDGEWLKSLGVLAKELDDVSVLTSYIKQYPKIHRPDAALLPISLEEKALLLTGDPDLREAAEREGIEVHGPLWLLDLLVSEKILGELDAADSLEQMLRMGSRLPSDECAKRIERWRKPGVT